MDLNYFISSCRFYQVDRNYELKHASFLASNTQQDSMTEFPCKMMNINI